MSYPGWPPGLGPGRRLTACFVLQLQMVGHRELAPKRVCGCSGIFPFITGGSF